MLYDIIGIVIGMELIWFCYALACLHREYTRLLEEKRLKEEREVEE